MAKIIVDGEEFDVPESVAGSEIKRAAHIDKDDVIYRMTDDGKHEIIEDNTQIRDGGRIGRIRPFTAGGTSR